MAADFFLTCPAFGTLVKIEFDRSQTSGRIVGVKCCSTPAGKKLDGSCNRECVDLLNEKVARMLREEE